MLLQYLLVLLWVHTALHCTQMNAIVACTVQQRQQTIMFHLIHNMLGCN
jgi:hypothetical protein